MRERGDELQERATDQTWTPGRCSEDRTSVLAFHLGQVPRLYSPRPEPQYLEVLQGMSVELEPQWVIWSDLDPPQNRTFSVDGASVVGVCGDLSQQHWCKRINPKYIKLVTFCPLWVQRGLCHPWWSGRRWPDVPQCREHRRPGPNRFCKPNRQCAEPVGRHFKEGDLRKHPEALQDFGDNLNRHLSWRQYFVTWNLLVLLSQVLYILLCSAEHFRTSAGLSHSNSF